MFAACTGPAFIVYMHSYQFYAVLGIHSGGVLNTQRAGLRFLPRGFLACKYTTRKVLEHNLIHFSDDNITELHIALFCTYFDFLSDMVTYIMRLLFIRRGLNMTYTLCQFRLSIKFFYSNY